MRKAGIVVHSRPHTTLKRLLVSPKDKDDTTEKCGVIYHLNCQDYSAEYIGEMERALSQRLKEHKREASPVAQHMKRQASTE